MAESLLITARVLEARVDFQEQIFRKPLQLSSGLITKITEARVTVKMDVGGIVAEGRGSIYLSDLWAWPEAGLSHEEKDRVLRDLTTQIAQQLSRWCGEGRHPLEHGLRLHHEISREKHPPILARAMCASPFDAAMHDATGLALGVSAFSFYRENHPISTDPLFEGSGTCAAIRDCLRREPARYLNAWWIVGARDNLDGDVATAARSHGYHCFKLKLLGKDSAADVARVIEVYRAALSWGIRHPQISVDSNEANPDSASVLDFLVRLRMEDRDAFTALAYLEQPTGRDITQAVHDWNDVAQLKPVLLDEGLTDLNLLPFAKKQGWSGLALKTCKGHSFALIAAAWARQNNMMLSVQDLTNPGLAAIHAFLLASHLPTINGVELNSPQYTPAANEEWIPRLAGLFQPADGVHHWADTNVIGLGSEL